MSGLSKHAKLFDRRNPNWHADPNHRNAFLFAQEQYANDLLRNDGYLFLNDVYRNLGMSRTRSGQVIGWVRSDGEVRFHILDKPSGETWVDFNLPGSEILDTLGD